MYRNIKCRDRIFVGSRHTHVHIHTYTIGHTFRKVFKIFQKLLFKVVCLTIVKVYIYVGINTNLYIIIIK